MFDECHLLNDVNRGATADVLLAQLFRSAPGMRMLLMSAMISNTAELANWLTSVRSSLPNAPAANAAPSKIDWRPSRAARGFVFLSKEPLTVAENETKAALATATTAKTLSREIPLGWISGLSGPWTLDGPGDYGVSELPITATFQQKRTRKGTIHSEFESWKNTTGLSVAELFAARGLPSINFVLTSRHHAFGSAEKVTMPIPGAVADGPLPSLVEAQLAIADVELGVPTRLRGLLRKGIAVHTSAMLSVEQAASELMFSDGKAKLIIATGTLAQGLNLPAVAVVVSGSQLPTPGPAGLKDVDAAAGITRATELILNGFGRAGRPGFANQGLVVLVSDKPFSAPIANDLDGESVLREFPVLGEPDASVAVRSPIEGFLDDLFVVEANATRLEVALTSLLSAFDDDDENAGTILRRTFAAYSRREVFTDELAGLARQRIVELKSKFLERDGVPEWMPKAAMKAGVDFFQAQRMWEACQVVGMPKIEQLNSLDVLSWLDRLFDVLSHLPVARIGGYRDDAMRATPRTRLTQLARQVTDIDTVPWARPAGWAECWQDLAKVVRSYMLGESYAAIGVALFGNALTDYTDKRSDGARGFPPVFKFVGSLIDRVLTVDAGCFLALHECWLEAEHPDTAVPDALQALPLCIRNGCDTLDALAWFRFGLRQRVVAHALAEAHPLPGEVESDAERAQAVREARRAWLDGEPDEPGSLLAAARTVITDGASERT